MVDALVLLMLRSIYMRRNSQPGRITGQNHAKDTLPGKPAGKTTANFPTSYVFITMPFLSVKH